jgi:uncharacterized LabA/DUF88 family protein
VTPYPPTPDEVRPTFDIERVVAYLDGFNIYNGMMAKGWGRYRWLDYPALLRRYLRAPQELVGIKYFTARMTHQPDKYARQQQYLRALEERGGIEILAGKFTSRRVFCRKCSKWFRVPQEKRTDVNLATHLVADAFDDQFDTFLICTADSDLIPAVNYVQERFKKRFFLIDPPRRHSDELAEIADGHLRSNKQFFRQSQLPDPVEYVTRRGKTKRIHKPASWADAGVAEPWSDPDEDGLVFCLTCNQPWPVSESDA